jgi:hypothetical protein
VLSDGVAFPSKAAARLISEVELDAYCHRLAAHLAATLPMKNNPFFRLLARLRVGRKLLLIYLLDLSAVIYISGILIHEKYLAIDFSNKEIVGNAYVRTAREALVDVALAGAGQQPHPARIAQIDANLVSAEARYGEHSASPTRPARKSRSKRAAN